MDETVKGGSASTDQGSAVDQNADVGSKTKEVRFEDHEKALKDMLRFKAEARESKAKLSDYEARLQAIENDRLMSEGKKDEVIEKYKAKLTELEDKDKKRTQAFIDSKKYEAVKEAALKAGLRKEAVSDLDLLPLDDVEVEMTDQGRFIVHNADSKVETLKKSKSWWFEASGAPRVNAGGVSGSSPDPKELTDGYMYSLEKKDPKKYRELWPKYVDQLKRKRMGLSG